MPRVIALGLALTGVGALGVLACRSVASQHVGSVATVTPTARPSSSASAVLPTKTSPVLIQPDRASLRARVLELEPAGPVSIAFRTGGEGAGGPATRGKLGETLALGEWSPRVSFSQIWPKTPKDRGYVTLTVGHPGTRPAAGDEREGHSRGAVFEIELYDGEVLKQTLKLRGPEGGTVTLSAPSNGPSHQVGAIEQLQDIAAERLQALQRPAWASLPTPQRLAIVSDLGGYGTGFGYGIRHTDPDISRADARVLRALGVNGLRAAPSFLLEEWQRAFGVKVRVVGPLGFPVPTKRYADTPDLAGCPWADDVATRSAELAQKLIEEQKASPAQEVWALTRDEISAVTNLATDGRSHLAHCDRCARAFRAWLQEQGESPAALGATRLEDVRPLDIWSGKRGEGSDSRRAKLAYLTWKFQNYSTAHVFTPLRDALAQHNLAKRAAAADSPFATQPYIYSYALRSNTFLMRGYDLDFFDFYRYADNAVVWESSNRDARAWIWEGYLDDVQRVLTRELGIVSGAYVKPTRGAAVQRALSAAARGSRLLYWYTYGPDYWKGDGFSSDAQALEQASLAAHLLGGAESYVVEAKPAPARVAIVRPETSQAWLTLYDASVDRAASENSKWIYTALTHEHVPVDPLDERFLQQLDLSRYVAIYVSGTHLTRAAATALSRYVERGGTLYTSGFGVAKDEAGKPLASLYPVFGLQRRNEPEMWCEVQGYAATQLAALDGCAEHDALSGADFTALKARVGREVLVPKASTRVLARFADGAPALLSNDYGKGHAILSGFFAGLEYAAPVLRPGFDMQRDFNAERRRFITFPLMLSAVAPLRLSDALVEGTLLQGPKPNQAAIVLVNWAYRDAGSPEYSGLVEHVAPVSVEGLSVFVRGLSQVQRVASTALKSELKVEQEGEGIRIQLPHLAAGDILTVN